eukprot:6475575-Amphidinium_carterae.1
MICYQESPIERNATCHTFIARCADGCSRPQLAGRATSTVLVQRQREGQKSRVSRHLRSVPHRRVQRMIQRLIRVRIDRDLESIDWKCFEMRLRR